MLCLHQPESLPEQAVPRLLAVANGNLQGALVSAQLHVRVSEAGP